MYGNDRARHLLIAACLLSLGADALFPREGATQQVISASFWIYCLAIVAFSIRQLVLRARHGAAVPILKWGLLCVYVVSLFAYGSHVFERKSPPSQVLAFLLIGTFLALVFLAIRDAVRHVRSPNSERHSLISASGADMSLRRRPRTRSGAGGV